MSSLQTLTPDAQIAFERLFGFAQLFGYDPQIRSARRSCAEQEDLFNLGRTVPGAIVTGARGCQSWHVLGRALDLDLGNGATREDYEFLGKQWERMGGVWGGRFTNIGDPGHFEWHPGRTISEECPQAELCSKVVQASAKSSTGPALLVGAAGVLFAGFLYGRK